MLVIWGRSNSVNVQKVLWCCEELSLPYQRIDAGSAYGVVNTPQYRKLNPNALVPTLDDNGFILWESNAIVRYLSEAYGSAALWPSDRKIRAHADQWMDWMNTTYWPAIRPLFLGLVRTPVEQRDAKVLSDARNKTAEVVAILDVHLASQTYVAGDTFSMGDIALGCGIWRWLNLPVERPKAVNVARWFEALTQRPAYRKIVMHPLT